MLTTNDDRIKWGQSGSRENITNVRIKESKSENQENDTIKKASRNTNHNFIQGPLENVASQPAANSYNNVNNTNIYSDNNAAPPPNPFETDHPNWISKLHKRKKRHSLTCRKLHDFRIKKAQAL